MPTFSEPGYNTPPATSAVAKTLTPEISPASAARGLGDKFPYAGGAMVTHVPGAGMHNSAHSFGPAAGPSAHVVHNTRFVG